jgi:Rrf2 family protein
MTLSTKTRYGLRILIQLAEIYGQNIAVKGKDIAIKQNFTEAYLEQIMIKLKEAGLIRTERGRNGGYILVKSPDDITILDVLEVFEGRLDLVRCKEDTKVCPMIRQCKTTRAWKKLSDTFRAEASKLSLTKILEMNKQEMEYMI